MLSALGPHHLDAPHRAVVIGVLPSGDDTPTSTAADLVRHGADVVEIDHADAAGAVAAAVDRPVAVHVARATETGRALDAGVTLVVTPDRAAIADARVLVSVDVPGDAAGIGTALRTIADLVDDGRTVAATPAATDRSPGVAIASISLAVASGARAVRVGNDDVGSARRVVDVMARILGARPTGTVTSTGEPAP